MQDNKGKKDNVRKCYLQTSVTKKAWKPYGTLWGNGTTATGSGDIVFASITVTDDFLQMQTINYHNHVS